MTEAGDLVPGVVERADQVVAAATAQVRAYTGTHLLDALGCLVAGSGHPSADRLRQYADLLGDSGSTPVVGGGRPRSLGLAVTLEAAYLHLDEYDAIHSAGAVVPPAVVVPAALAVAAHHGCSGRDLTDAMLGGYDVVVEAALRLGGPALYAERWWPTATLGALGAAWASARLLGLDHAGRCRAVTLAAHAVGGPIGGAELGEGHYLEGGRAAACGVAAAYQAAAGLRGDVTLLDGGLPGGPGRRPAAATPGVAPHLTDCSFKRYPFARPLHAALAALDGLATAGVPVARAVRVDVHVPAPLSRFITATATPRGPAEAAASACVAVAGYLAGRADDVRFVRAAAECPVPVVTLVPDQDLVADLPERWSSRVVAHLPDGGTESAYAPDAPALRDEASVVEKYRRNVAGGVPGPAEELLALCRDLDAVPAAPRIRDLVCRSGEPTPAR